MLRLPVDHGGPGNAEPRDTTLDMLLAQPDPRPGASAAGVWFWILLVGHLGIVWLVPVLPAQDLPQHLSYVRILLDHDRPDLRFAEFYERVPGTQSYFNTYYLIVGLAQVLPVEAAARVVFSLYVVGMFLAFRWLVVVAGRRGPRSGAATPLLASMLVWNPVACMGFLPFTLAMPVLIAGIAAMVAMADLEKPRAIAVWGILAAAAAAGSLHIVANK